MDSDVIVVGGGPSGSFAALHAAKGGAETIICEEHEAVGIPTHCTGHVSLSGLNNLNLILPKSIIENKIKGAKFYSPKGNQFSVRFNNPITCVINRRLFDQYLCDNAAEEGVNTLYNTCVKALLIESNEVKGVVVKNKKNHGKKMLSKLVIDAEGASSNLLKKAKLPMISSKPVVKGIHAEADRVTDLETDNVEVYLSSTFTPGFYSWIVPRFDGTAKIGLGTQRGNPLQCLRALIKHHPIFHHRLKGSTINNFVYHPILVDGPISRCYYNGLLVAGDAASHIKPTTGGGVIMGLTCAKIAGIIAASSCKNDDSSATFLSNYGYQCKKRIGFDIKIMKYIRRLLNRLSDTDIDKLINLCYKIRLEDSLRNVQDIDFQGTSLIKMAKNPKIIMSVFNFLIRSII